MDEILRELTRLMTIRMSGALLESGGSLELEPHPAAERGMDGDAAVLQAEWWSPADPHGTPARTFSITIRPEG